MRQQESNESPDSSTRRWNGPVRNPKNCTGKWCRVVQAELNPKPSWWSRAMGSIGMAYSPPMLRAVNPSMVSSPRVTRKKKSFPKCVTINGVTTCQPGMAPVGPLSITGAGRGSARKKKSFPKCVTINGTTTCQPSLVRLQLGLTMPSVRRRSSSKSIWW